MNWLRIGVAIGVGGAGFAVKALIDWRLRRLLQRRGVSRSDVDAMVRKHQAVMAKELARALQEGKR